MKIHFVYAVLATTQALVVLYLGRDGAEAEQAFLDNHLDGDFESVHWCPELRHFRHTTPARDNCEKRGRCHEAPTIEDATAAAERIADLERQLSEAREQLSAATKPMPAEVAAAVEATEQPAEDAFEAPAGESVEAAAEAPSDAKPKKTSRKPKQV
jgi:hypothetical protein